MALLNGMKQNNLFTLISVKLTFELRLFFIGQKEARCTFSCFIVIIVSFEIANYFYFFVYFFPPLFTGPTEKTV